MSVSFCHEKIVWLLENIVKIWPLIIYLATPVEVIEACRGNPCGPNSQCRDNNGAAICSCLPGFVGSAPACRPECVVSSECALDKACVNQKCVNPCSSNVCGTNADCRVNNHSPICTCRNGYTGNPFTICNAIPRMYFRKIGQYPLTTKFNFESDNVLAQYDTTVAEYINPCLSSPCGPFSRCEPIGDYPSCSCLPSYYGSPPNCHQECALNSDCPSNKACIRNHCIDPCPGSCGIQAVCSVFNHVPVCTCPDRYTGNAFSNCYPIPPQSNFFISDYFYPMKLLQSLIINRLYFFEIKFFPQCTMKYLKIGATHRHVQTMHSVIMVFARVWPVCKAIHTLFVALNVFWTAIVPETRLVYEANAPIRATVLVHRTRCVRCIITYRCALAQPEWKETHLFSVAQSCNTNRSKSITAAGHRRAAALLNAEK